MFKKLILVILVLSLVSFAACKKGSGTDESTSSGDWSSFFGGGDGFDGGSGEGGEGVGPKFESPELHVKNSVSSKAGVPVTLDLSNGDLENFDGDFDWEIDSIDDELDVKILGNEVEILSYKEGKYFIDVLAVDPETYKWIKKTCEIRRENFVRVRFWGW